MTRFVMSIDQASRLVIESAGIAQGGEVFITKMPVINIKDLAEVMINELSEKYGHAKNDISIIEIGTKPGEKLYEELMSDEETRRSVELNDYFSVLPAFRGLYKNIGYDYSDVISDVVVNPYNSSNEPVLNQAQLKEFLIKNNLLEGGVQADTHPDKRYWPGDKEEL